MTDDHAPTCERCGAWIATNLQQLCEDCYGREDVHEHDDRDVEREDAREFWRQVGFLAVARILGEAIDDAAEPRTRLRDWLPAGLCIIVLLAVLFALWGAI